MDKRNFSKKGFTLVEVIVVVIISLVVVSFSFPVYKKTQERNRYMAAQGVLVDLANGVRMLKAENPTISFSGSVTSNATTSDSLTASNAIPWMMANKYINPIRFDQGATTYMGYAFTVNSSGAASCGSYTGVACMSGTSSISEYTCSCVDSTGILY
jgi:prepilin-type N-terminal cleavage/methylation domain-containing protein